MVYMMIKLQIKNKRKNRKIKNKSNKIIKIQINKKIRMSNNSQANNNKINLKRKKEN